MSLNPNLLDILVCPISKTSLVYDKQKQELISTAANLAFPVRDDIPVMLEDEARQITPEEAEHYRKLKA
ncbi:Trm112 family protein [Thiomicrospira microaerophila]|uniref:Trm112 family protein n=1 Tax=Thiomicrospira microaerophila TaxID=406020 RepID=UPI0005CAFA07|nr:Trm112 family protein [Thiomicrospira microaerophila]